MNINELPLSLFITVAEIVTEAQLRATTLTHRGINKETLIDPDNNMLNFSVKYNPHGNFIMITIFSEKKIINTLLGKVIFLEVSGFSIASRLEFKVDNVITNYITLPHFITLREGTKNKLTEISKSLNP